MSRLKCLIHVAQSLETVHVLSSGGILRPILRGALFSRVSKLREEEEKKRKCSNSRLKQSDHWVEMGVHVGLFSPGQRIALGSH